MIPSETPAGTNDYAKSLGTMGDINLSVICKQSREVRGVLPAGTRDSPITPSQNSVWRIE